MKRDRILHYAAHYALIDWVRLGWIIVKPEANCIPHDFYNATVEWLCDCPIVRPVNR